MHRVVGGAGAVPLATRTPPPELARHVDFEPPLDNAETISFSVRQTADRVVAGLAAQQLVCTEVRIEAFCEGTSYDDARVVARLAAPALVHRGRPGRPAALAAAGHGIGRAGRDIRAPVSRVLFTPMTVVPDAVHADGLWGGTDERVQRGIARVQGMLGHEAVVVPVLQGGRAPADRQALVPWGERPTGLRPAGPPVAGQHPAARAGPGLRQPVAGRGRRPRRPSGRGRRARGGARRADPVPARAPRRVAARRRLGRPVAGRGAVVGGPARRVARFQVVGVDGRAWLMTWEAPGSWWTEAAYD